MPAKLLPEVANELLDQFAKEKGVTFTTPFVNCSTPLRFLCTECGKETKITWGQVQQGKNPNMLCLDCSYRQRSKTSSLSYDELKAEIEAKGSLLLNSHEEKLNTHTYLSLICTITSPVASLFISTSILLLDTYAISIPEKNAENNIVINIYVKR